MKKPKIIRKKRRRISPLDQALSVCEDAWKSAIERRAKGICEVHGSRCEGPFQVDHFVSRRHGSTFFMHQNGTFVCAGLNMQKGNGWGNAAEKIAAVVMKREGAAMVDYLLETCVQPKKWTILDLENLTYELNGMWRK